jgi:DNA (cytosine-5)-methyltransferase 1
MSLTSGALFAGYGGLDLAVEGAFGATTAWVSEFDAAPSTILAARFPDAPNLGDVTKVDWASVPPVDIITGGSPCQDLSHAGKRAGMKAGTRSGLWASMCDAIETIRPAFVVWENVRGALSASADSAVEPCPICVGDGDGVTLRALGRVLGDLAELGYDAAWTGIRAADVGAPHGRFRVFVLAWPADAAGDSRWIGGGDSGPAAQPTDLGHERPGASRDGRTRSADGRGGAVALLPTPTVGDSKAARNSTALRHKTPPTGVHAGDTLTDAVVPARGLSRDFGVYAAAIARWEAALGRPAPAPTEPTGKGGAHRLSPRFVEWLMGLDDGWVRDVGLTRNEQLKALGNGVVPQQATAALHHLLAVRAAAITREAVAA